MNLGTKAGALAYAERRRGEMVRCFERMGRFEDHGNSFCAVLFGTRELVAPKGDRRDPDAWGSGEALREPKAIDVFLPQLPLIRSLHPVQQKDAFAYLIREYARKVKAIGLLFMSEMWWAQMTGPDPETAMKERAARPDSLEDWDDRREGLFMQMEHAAAGKAIWFNVIQRNPTRLEGWESKPIDDVGGRFVNLVEWQS